MPTIACPECDEGIHVPADVEQGDVIECDECGESLEVVGLDPIELDPYVDDDLDAFNDSDDDEDEDNGFSDFD